MSRVTDDSLYEFLETIQAKVAYRWIPESCGKILEIGCSSGYFTRRLLDKAQEVHGIDINEKHIQMARSKYPEIDFRVSTATHLPYEDNLFDVLVMLEVYEHIEDERKVIEEIFRVLKPGGVLILSTPNRGIFEVLDPYNMKMRLKGSAPRLFSIIRKLQRYQSTQYRDNLIRHRHYSLADIEQAFEGRFTIYKVHRSGLLMYPVCSALQSITSRLTGWRVPNMLLHSLKNVDGSMNYGRFSYNLMVMAKKLEAG
ncbi:class I SAM-dependent methyltransferase [Chloroflexota bacterium]